MKKYVPIILRIIVALILLNTLRFKFTAHPDSVYIFTQVGMEPTGRIAIGIVELLAAILLLIPRTVWLGAVITKGVLAGAIFMHLTSLGIEIKGDGGLLFYTAIITFILSAIVLYLYRKQIPFIKT